MGKVKLFVLSLAVLGAGAMVAVKPAGAQSGPESLVKDPGLKQMLGDAHSHQSDLQTALGNDVPQAPASPGLRTDFGHKAPMTGKIPAQPAPGEKLTESQGTPVQTADKTATPVEEPKVSTIAELLSFVNVKSVPAKPFSDEASTRSRAKQGKLSMSAAEALAAKGSPALSGRTIAISGTVANTSLIEGGMRQVLVANSGDKQRVAFLVTLPRGDEHQPVAGEKITLNAVAIQTVFKPKCKGALVTALGGNFSDWADEGTSLSDLATQYGRPVSGSSATAAEKTSGTLHGWEVGGIVSVGSGGTAVLRKPGGRVIYADNGQLVEPGLRMVKATIDGVTFRVDNKPVSVRP